MSKVLMNQSLSFTWESATDLPFIHNEYSLNLLLKPNFSMEIDDGLPIIRDE